MGNRNWQRLNKYLQCSADAFHKYVRSQNFLRIKVSTPRHFNNSNNKLKEVKMSIKVCLVRLVYYCVHPLTFAHRKLWKKLFFEFVQVIFDICVCDDVIFYGDQLQHCIIWQLHMNSCISLVLTTTTQSCNENINFNFCTVFSTI